MKILTKIKNLFRKTETTIKDNWIFPEPMGLIHYFDSPSYSTKEESISMSMKIATQKIGLDLVEVKHNPNIVMESGYIDFKEDVKLSPEEILFQMKKVKRASEKVLDEMIETEKKFNKSLEYYNNKAEHKVEHKEQPKIAKPKTKNVK